MAPCTRLLRKHPFEQLLRGVLRAVTFHISPVFPSFLLDAQAPNGVLMAVTCKSGVRSRGAGMVGEPQVSLSLQ